MPQSTQPTNPQPNNYIQHVENANPTTAQSPGVQTKPTGGTTKVVKPFMSPEELAALRAAKTNGDGSKVVEMPKKTTNREAPSSAFPEFPESAYFGVAAKFAELYASRYESPKEFFYIDFLTILGTIVSGRIRVENGDAQTQPRLYVLKVATSAWRRKSQSTTCALRFLKNSLWRSTTLFDQIANGPSSPISLIPGVGSAEGLGNCFLHDSGRRDEDDNPILIGNRRVLVMFDEFRRLEKKGAGDGAVLLEMFCELFEKNEYYNIVKDRPLTIDDGHLGCLANTTKENYETLVDARAMQDGGFLNRWFIVSVDRPRIRKPRIKHPSDAELKPLYDEMVSLLKKLPPLSNDGVATEEIVLDMTPDAEKLWDEWYNAVDETDATARLDSYGYRLMGLFAFLAGKNVVDAEVMRAVLYLLEYQQKIRELHKPIIANNDIAQMEQRIMAKMVELESKLGRGVILKRELQNAVKASRYGLGVFNQALANLFKNGQLRDGQFTDHNGKCKVTKNGYKLAED